MALTHPEAAHRDRGHRARVGAAARSARRIGGRDRRPVTRMLALDHIEAPEARRSGSDHSGDFRRFGRRATAFGRRESDLDFGVPRRRPSAAGRIARRYLARFSTATGIRSRPRASNGGIFRPFFGVSTAGQPLKTAGNRILTVAHSLPAGVERGSAHRSRVLIWRVVCQGVRRDFFAFAVGGVGGCGRLGWWRSGGLCATRGQADIRGLGAAGPWFVVGSRCLDIGRGQPRVGAGCS